MTQSIHHPRISIGLGITLAIMTAGLLSGCSKTSSHSNIGQSPLRETQMLSSTQQAVHTIGETSEDLYDDAKMQEWKNAFKKLSKLEKAQAEFDARPVSKDSQKKIAQLSTDLSQQIANQNRLSAMEDANKLTRMAIDIGHSTTTTIPTEVSLLDYYGRELEIGSMSKDNAQLTHTTRDIKQTWKSLKPKLNTQSKKRGVTDEETRFELLVTQLDHAKTYPEYHQLAVQLLDQVDQLESVFTQG